MALSTLNRLPLKNQRERIDKEGIPSHSSFFTIVKAPVPDGVLQPRFAVLVSKKISNLAVDRNLLKRRVLSAVQEILPSLTTADYLIIPKKTTQEIEYKELLKDLTKILH